MVLAAGYGTRLGTLSDERPKVLLPMVDTALIRYGLALLANAGIRDVVVNLHHKAELITTELGDGSSAGVRVHYSREPVILGTGGGIKKAAPLLGNETFVVVNGKVVIELDLRRVLEAHKKSGAVATMVVRRDPDATRWGAIDVDDGGRVRGILGTGGFMFTGIHVLEPEMIRRIPDGEQCVIRTAYLDALKQGAPLYAFVADGYFAEHSTPERYLRGNIALLRGVGTPEVPWPLRGVDPSAKIAPGAVLHEPVRIGPRAIIEEGATVGPDVVVGHDAVVARGARLQACVVWDGARAEGDLARTIVTHRGIHTVVGGNEPGW